MLTDKDKIEQFKRDLRSYTYHQKMVEELQYKLIELNVKIQGVSSPTMKPVVLENAGDPYKNKRSDYWEEEEKLVLERNKHQSEINKINSILNEANEIDKRILIDVYIRRKRIDSLDYVYWSVDQKKRHINNVIKKFLNL